MKLYSINTGYFKLDGGAMFGVVPKTIWNKINPSDELNMCRWAMRSLLIEDGNRLILVDNGIGNKQSEKFFSNFFLHGDDTLDTSLARLGFHRNDITDIILTHLHFDHCGGSIEWNSTSNSFRPAFLNARFWSNELHWDWAMNPNVREKASFLKENFVPIQESGQLEFIREGESPFERIELHFVNGHTEAQMIPVVQYKDKKIVFCADLCPSIGHIKPNYVMAYDVRPLDSMRERQTVMEKAAAGEYILFFEHDPLNECATVKSGERGFEAGDIFLLSDLV
jgi:glyoxylase-like metal-dependent hydrolase (beta-lactamase superfamily II)